MQVARELKTCLIWTNFQYVLHVINAYCSSTVCRSYQVVQLFQVVLNLIQHSTGGSFFQRILDLSANNSKDAAERHLNYGVKPLADDLMTDDPAVGLDLADPSEEDAFLGRGHSRYTRDTAGNKDEL